MANEKTKAQMDAAFEALLNQTWRNWLQYGDGTGLIGPQCPQCGGKEDTAKLWGGHKEECPNAIPF